MPDVSHDTDAARTALCDYIWTLMEQFGDKLDIREHDEQIHRLARALAAAARAEGAEAERERIQERLDELVELSKELGRLDKELVEARNERDAALAMVPPRCATCDEPLLAHEWVEDGWQGGDDWAQHVYTPALAAAPAVVWDAERAVLDAAFEWHESEPEWTPAAEHLHYALDGLAAARAGAGEERV